MPAGITVGHTTMTVKGGRRLQRFVSATANPYVRARHGARSVKKRVLPELRRAVPRRTGELRRSLRVQQRGSRVELRGNEYAPIVRWRIAPNSPRRTSVAEQATRIVIANRKGIQQDIVNGILSELGG